MKWHTDVNGVKTPAFLAVGPVIVSVEKLSCGLRRSPGSAGRGWSRGTADKGRETAKFNRALCAMPIYKVLVVDDSDDDRWLLCRALRDFPSLQIVADLADGDEAVAYL